MADEINYGDTHPDPAMGGDVTRPGDQFVDAGRSADNLMGTYTKLYTALGAIKDITIEYNQVLSDQLDVEDTMNTALEGRVGLYRKINDQLRENTRLVKGFRNTGGLPAGGIIQPLQLPAGGEPPQDQEELAKLIGEQMKEAMTPLLALEGYSLMRGGGRGGGEGGEGGGGGVRGGLFLGSLLGDSGGTLKERFKAIGHGKGIPGVLSGIMHNPIMAARMVLPELAPVFGAYELANLAGHEYLQTRQLGQITGQGFSAGLSARMEQFTLGGNLGGLNPFTPISGAVAAAIVRGVRQAGFSDSIAHALDNSVANVVASVGLPVDTAIEFFSKAMREGGESMQSVERELKSFGSQAHNAGDSLTDYTQRVMDLSTSLRAGGAGSGATGIATNLAQIFGQKYGFTTQESQQLGAVFGDRQTLLRAAIASGAPGINPMTTPSDQMVGPALNFFHQWIGRAKMVAGPNAGLAEQSVAFMNLLQGFGINITADTARNLIKRDTATGGFRQQYHLTGPGGLTHLLARHYRARVKGMFAGEGLDTLSSLGARSDVKVFLKKENDLYKQRDYFKAYTTAQDFGRHIMQSSLAHQFATTARGRKWLKDRGFTDKDIHTLYHWNPTLGRLPTQALNEMMRHSHFMGAGAAGAAWQQRTDLDFAKKAFESHAINRSQYNELRKRIRTDPGINLFSESQRFSDILKKSDKTEALFQDGNSGFSVRIYVDKDGKVALDRPRQDAGSLDRQKRFGDVPSQQVYNSRSNFGSPQGGGGHQNP